MTYISIALLLVGRSITYAYFTITKSPACARETFCLKRVVRGVSEGAVLDLLPGDHGHRFGHSHSICRVDTPGVLFAEGADRVLQGSVVERSGVCNAIDPVGG